MEINKNLQNINNNLMIFTYSISTGKIDSFSETRHLQV